METVEQQKPTQKSKNQIPKGIRKETSQKRKENKNNMANKEAALETYQTPTDAKGQMTEEQLDEAMEVYHADLDAGKGELVIDYEETNNHGEGNLTKEQEAFKDQLLYKQKKIGKSVFEYALGRR